jgi:SAM-dependent methyltransferase
MIASWFSKGLASRYRRFQDRLFDYRNGVDTHEDHVDYVARLPAASAEWAVPYEPIQTFMFHRIMGQVPVDHRNFAFVDLGSGKGRAVLLAATYGFARVIGVELSAELDAIARSNVERVTRRVRSSSPIELVCGDARTYSLPCRSLVVFLYNPFVGDVLEDVVLQLERHLASDCGDLWILYRNPQCAERFARIPGLVQHAESHSYKIYRRASAPLTS